MRATPGDFAVPAGPGPVPRQELTGPGTGDYPGRPAWRCQPPLGGSTMSAACRSARAICSRSLTFAAPGSARRPARAAASRRALPARRRCGHPPGRGLGGAACLVSQPPGDQAAEPGALGRGDVLAGAGPEACWGRQLAAGLQAPPSPHLAIPDGLACMTGRERFPPGSCVHGDHLYLTVPIIRRRTAPIVTARWGRGLGGYWVVSESAALSRSARPAQGGAERAGRRIP